MLEKDFKINKKEYPLEVVFILDEEGGYLKEREGKFIPCASIKTLISPSIYLSITPPLIYSFSAGEFSGSTFTTTATTNMEGSLSFFGTDRIIEEVEIKIFPTHKGMQLEFWGDLSNEYEDWEYSFSEEHIYLSMAIKHNQFKRILRAWELDNIDEMFCSIELKQINGLYKLDTISPYVTYKILPDRRMVKNYQDMPENFTDFANSKTSYASNDCFSLTIRKQRFGKRNEEQFNKKSIFKGEEISTNELAEERLKLLIEKLDEIKKYSLYAVVIMALILLRSCK